MLWIPACLVALFGLVVGLVLWFGSLSDDRNRHVCDPRPRRRSF